MLTPTTSKEILSIDFSRLNLSNRKSMLTRSFSLFIKKSINKDIDMTPDISIINNKIVAKIKKNQKIGFTLISNFKKFNIY